jgi:hypothetical protein
VRGVNYSPALKWSFLLLLIALTLGWKWTGQAKEPTEREVQLRVAEFLARQNYTVVRSAEAKQGEPTVRATAAPTCRMLVINSPVLGWDQDTVRRLATAADRVFVVFRGKVYGDPPSWLTISDFLWSRLRRELGLKFETNPVFTVIATTSCEAERLPWDELGPLDR